MDIYIKEMFDSYSQEYISPAYLWYDIYNCWSVGFIIFTRAYKISERDIQKFEDVKKFYYSLEKYMDLKKARIASGLNAKDAQFYVDFLNKEFKKRRNELFYNGKGRIRNKRERGKLISEDEFIYFLDNITA